MKKKYMKFIKIFLALVMIFSQLSNSIVVFADEIDDSADTTSENEVIENEETSEEDEEIVEDEETNEESTDDEGNQADEELPSENIDDQNDEETTEEDVVEVVAEKEFTLEDLEAIVYAYLNDSELSLDLIELLKEKEAPCIENGEFTEISLRDIMFVNELLKEESDTETEREENENLSLILEEGEEEIKIGDTFDIKVLISNEKKEDLEGQENTAEEVSDYIDGIEGTITTSDNLKINKIEFTGFNGLDKDGKFVGYGSPISEDKAVIMTITIEALEEGEGEVTINGSTAKYLTFTEFEELKYSINVTPKEESGLTEIISDVGFFDKEFDKDILEYTLTVPYDIEEITLSGALEDENATVTGLSSYTLSDNETIATIVVTSSDGSTKTYTVTIIKEEKVEEPVEEPTVEVISYDTVAPIVYYVYSSNNYLKSLNIKDYDINFEKGILEYKLKVAADVKTLEITALPEDYRSKVEINGNEEFKEGENVVTIKVTAENGNVREYKLLVNKEAPKDVTDDEETGKTEKIIIIILIILVVLGLLYLIFKKDDEDKKVDKLFDGKNNNKEKNSKDNEGKNINKKNNNKDKNKKVKER